MEITLEMFQKKHQPRDLWLSELEARWYELLIKGWKRKQKNKTKKALLHKLYYLGSFKTGKIQLNYKSSKVGQSIGTLYDGKLNSLIY